MEPSDFSENDEAMSAAAGMLWALYTRLRGEGASAMEAAWLAGSYMAALVMQPSQKDDA